MSIVKYLYIIRLKDFITKALNNNIMQEFPPKKVTRRRI